MSRKKTKIVWKHGALADSVPVDGPVDGPLDVSADIRSGSRTKLFVCPVCTKPLTYRIWSAVKMDALCPNCRIAVLILKPSNEEVPAGTMPVREGRPFRNMFGYARGDETERRHG